MKKTLAIGTALGLAIACGAVGCMDGRGPSASTRLKRHLGIKSFGLLSAEKVRDRVMELVPVGSTVEDVYRFLNTRFGGDRAFVWDPAPVKGSGAGSRISCRVYDPFGVRDYRINFAFGEDRILQSVEVDAWATLP